MKITEQTDKITICAKRILVVLWLVCAVPCSENTRTLNPDEANTFRQICEYLEKEQMAMKQPLDGQGEYCPPCNEYTHSQPADAVPFFQARGPWENVQNGTQERLVELTPDEVAAELGDTLEEAAGEEYMNTPYFFTQPAQPAEVDARGEENAPSTSHEGGDGEKKEVKRRGRKRKGDNDGCNKNASVKKKPQKKAVSADLSQLATAENLEKVIAVNRAMLEKVKERQQADLDGTTKCRAGSLEWIGRMKDILQAAAAKMEDKEMRTMLEDAVWAYEQELAERTEFANEAITSWIPDYEKALDAFSNKKETVAELFRSGKWNDRVSAMAAFSAINYQTYSMVGATLQKGLEDMANGRNIQGLKRNGDDLGRDFEKRREFRAEKSAKDGTNAPTRVQYHIKNTVFYPVVAAFTYDACNRNNHKQRGSKRPFVSICEKLEDCRNKLEAFEKKKESIEDLEKKEAVRMRKEEVEVLSDACTYLEGYVKSARVLNAKHFNVLYVEGVEAYAMEEEKKGGGRLERTLKALCRIMEKSGHLENVGKKRRGEKVGKDYLKNNYKSKMMAKWLKAVRSEMSKPKPKRTTKNANTTV